MKKIILFTAILFSAVTLVNAQTASDEVTLNVKLTPIQTIYVNGAQDEINLEYKNDLDYADGVTSSQVDHLTVYSTGAFAVSVASKDESIKGNRGDKVIPSNTLTVTASDGTTNSLKASYTSVDLALAAQDLITSTEGGVNRNFNVTYKGKGLNEYVNNYVKGEGEMVYSTTLTYAIVAK